MERRVAIDYRLNALGNDLEKTITAAYLTMWVLAFVVAGRARLHGAKKVVSEVLGHLGRGLLEPKTLGFSAVNRNYSLQANQGIKRTHTW